MKTVPLKLRTASGVVWNFSDLMLRRGVGGVTTLILAWFLVPEDFGLMAMMVVFLALSKVVVDGGLSQALIRQYTVTQCEYSTAFFANIGIAVLVYAVLFAGAPLIAGFYQEPRLVDLMRVAGIAVVFNAFTLVQRAALSRELKFSLQMWVSLPAVLVSGVVAVGLAYAGYGVWALVAQMLVTSLFTSVMLWGLGLWRPTYELGWPELRRLFNFGGYLLVAQLTNAPFRYMYVVVIAKLFSTTAAGFYFFAGRIRDIIVDQLVSSVQTVTFPALAKFQDDTNRLKQGYRQVIAVTTFLVFPVLTIIAAVADSLFQLLLPKAWHPATVYLQLMCLAALLSPLHSINLNILKVRGRSDLVLYLGLFKKALAIAILVISYRFGIVGILIGQIVHSLLAYFPNSIYAKRLINYSLKEQLADFGPGLMMAMVVGATLWWAERSLGWNVLVESAVLVCAGIGFYLLCAYALKLKGLTIIANLVADRMKSSVATQS